MARVVFVALLLLAICATANSAQAPLVNFESGQVSGLADATAESFLGIPYAAPPVGKLRWRMPQPAPPWAGVRKAQKFGSDCMQTPFPSDAAPLGTEPAEDCLVLNVWRPAGTKANARLPVLVWIYGGGEVNGGASPDVYSGRPFARDGVMFVSFNYRVGRFGYFSFPELTRLNADGGLLNNYGAMDAIEALRWVKRNIAAFGGDPSQVTIYGQSAGAGQVCLLMASPLAKGLFSRAVIQSGGGTSIERPPLQSAEEAGVAFARTWGIEGTGADALARLRALSPQQITDGLHIGTRAAQATTFAGSVTDGRILTESLLSAVAAARQAKIPLLIGMTTADNYALILKARTLDEAFATTFSSVADKAKAAYLTDAKADPQFILREMGRDLMYAEPARFIADKMTAQGLPVYEYHFGYVAEVMRSEWVEGPPHATDIPFSMDTLQAKYGDKLTGVDIAMARAVHAYWVNFIRSGNPNGPGLPSWPAHDPGADVVMDFSSNGSVRAIPDPRKERLEVVRAARGR